MSATSAAARTSPSRRSQAVFTAVAWAFAPHPERSHRQRLAASPKLSGVSKRTVKRKLRAKKKANHGKKPNCGRG
ncbi:MAG: 50S ribosomal protein bL37 [Acidimicrobiales bacterium]